MRGSHAIFVVGLAAFATACQPTAPSGLSEADRAAIKQGEDQWVTLTNAKDWMAATQAYWTSDAAILPPKQLAS